jgi:hypothetical protein
MVPDTPSGVEHTRRPLGIPAGKRKRECASNAAKHCGKFGLTSVMPRMAAGLINHNA